MTTAKLLHEAYNYARRISGRPVAVAPPRSFIDRVVNFLTPPETIRQHIREREDAIRQWHLQSIQDTFEIAARAEDIANCTADIATAEAEIAQLRERLPLAERTANFDRRINPDRRIAQEQLAIFRERRKAARRLADKSATQSAGGNRAATHL